MKKWIKKVKKISFIGIRYAFILSNPIQEEQNVSLSFSNLNPSQSNNELTDEKITKRDHKGNNWTTHSEWFWRARYSCLYLILKLPISTSKQTRRKFLPILTSCLRHYKDFLFILFFFLSRFSQNYFDNNYINIYLCITHLRGGKARQHQFYFIPFFKVVFQYWELEKLKSL